MDDQQRAREQFEAWARSKGLPTHRRDYPLSERLGEYGDAYTAKYWEAWQVAITVALRAAPEGFVMVPVDSVLPCGCGCYRVCCRSCGTELGGFDSARPQGVK